MNPPSEYEVTSPSAQRINKTTAIVHSMMRPSKSVKFRKAAIWPSERCSDWLVSAVRQNVAMCATVLKGAPDYI